MAKRLKLGTFKRSVKIFLGKLVFFIEEVVVKDL